MSILAQFDLVKPKGAPDSEVMRSFHESASYVNDLAERQPGFIWREKNEEQALLDKLWGPGYLYTLSLWQSTADLQRFLYNTPHVEFMKRGKEWFKEIERPRHVLWWVESGHLPTLREAHGRLILLHEIGPSLKAFNLNTCDFPHVLP